MVKHELYVKYVLYPNVLVSYVLWKGWGWLIISWKTLLKWMIWGYAQFWKHPFSTMVKITSFFHHHLGEHVWNLFQKQIQCLADHKSYDPGSHKPINQTSYDAWKGQGEGGVLEDGLP